MSTDKRTVTSEQGSKAKRRKKDANRMVLARELSDDEMELEKLVFGEDNTTDSETDNDELGEEEPSTHTKTNQIRRAAWHDKDDDTLLIEDKLKQFKRKDKKLEKKKAERLDEHVQKMFLEKHSTPAWAQKMQENEDKDLLQVARSVISRSSSLSSGLIEVQKCRDLNYEAKTKNIIKSVEFHPSAQVALVAGFSGTTDIFQVDGKKNAKIHSIHFQDYPISVAHFTIDGEQIIVGSKEHPHFYCYDMMSGKMIKVPFGKGTNQKNVGQFTASPDGKIIALSSKSGTINLIASKSKEFIGSLKMNGEVKALAFNGNGSRLYSHGDFGQVYVWDMNSRRCTNKWVDEGCLTGTALALSPSEQYLATGSDSGVVNIYETSELANKLNPKPAKVFMNLTTTVTSLKFNHTAELLCMASVYKDNAIKLAHFPSMSVFSNFPLFSHSFKKPTCLDISLNSGFFALANNYGSAYLFRLKHYGNY